MFRILSSGNSSRELMYQDFTFPLREPVFMCLGPCPHIKELLLVIVAGKLP